MGAYSFRNDVLTQASVVARFHDVIETSRLDILTDVQNADQPGMRPGNRLKFFDAGEFPFIRAIIGERAAKDRLDRAERAHDVFRQPDFAVRTAPDTTNQFVVGNLRDRRRVGTGDRRRLAVAGRQ